MSWVVILPWFLFGAMGLLQAQPVPKSELDVSAQQRQLDAQRNELVRQTQDAEKACHDRFAVNDCLKAARIRSLEKNADLRRQQESLNDLLRQRDGQERIRQLEERKIQHEQSLRDSAVRPDVGAQRRDLGQNGDKRQPQQGSGPIKRGDNEAVRPQPRASGEGQQVYQRKLLDAERRRQERDKRIAEKARGKRSAPLPSAP